MDRLGHPNMFEEQTADLGPVRVTVKYVIDPVKGLDFLNEIYRYHRERRHETSARIDPVPVTCLSATLPEK
jgi:hypothetical protein